MAKAICLWAGGSPPPVKKEDDSMLYEKSGAVTKFDDVWVDHYNYFLHIFSKPGTTITLYFQPHDKPEIATPSFKIDANGHWGQDIALVAKGHGVTTSFKLRVGSTEEMTDTALREWPK
jgi:hypothetical protein